MHQYSDFFRDVQTDKPLPGSYEWWYFDAISVDGYSLVVIFYDGNPFSRRYIQALQSTESGKSGLAADYPAVSISIYKGGKHIYYSFEEVNPSDAHFSPDKPEVRIAGNSLYGDREGNVLKYQLNLDQKLPNGDRLAGKLTFSSETDAGIILSGTDKEFSSKIKQETHEWNLVQPKAIVTGSMKISGYHEEQISFDGIGYHDHNLGREPMKDSFEEWYWGRYHFDQYTVAYYLMKEQGEWKKHAWIWSEAGKCLEISDIGLSNYGFNPFGLYTARVIQFTRGDLSFHLHQDRVVDSGPFYQRFLGRAILKKGDHFEDADGISEYIRPGRIYNRFFWPLVDMRIAYPNEVHWVQKSPMLYRWTW